MRRVALTGGIGTGKTYVRQRFASLGVPTIDADAIVHQALEAGSALASAIASRFGQDMLLPSGAVNRRVLGARVFADPEARRDLEALVHPVVFEAIESWLASLTEPVHPGFALADVPLLFETHHEAAFDRVIVAACTPEVQVARVMARDRLSEPEARLRLQAQWPIAEKVARADYVIWTDRGFDETDRQVDSVYRLLATPAFGSR